MALRFAGGYGAWRAGKLAGYPRSAADLIVEVRDPLRLSRAERRAIADRVRRANMAVYATRGGAPRDGDLPRALGAQLGLRRLDANWLAGEDGVSSICVREATLQGEFIPYTSKPLRWHTDGYYNPPAERIRAFILHCARAAHEGGETSLLDHEMAYLLLRDADPAWARALTRARAMTIPARLEGGRAVRAAQSGPVFSRDRKTGALHMRYTARPVNVAWADDPETQAAVAFLAGRLSGDAPFVLRLRLAPGMGVVCNNVLHARSAFRDDPQAPRLLYRARFRDRIAID